MNGESGDSPFLHIEQQKGSSNFAKRLDYSWHSLHNINRVW